MKYIDLTMTIEEGMTTFPVYWHPVVEITQLGRLGMEKRETRKLVLGTHTGTHIDAPRHFIAGGDTVEQLPLEQLCGRAVVLDCTGFAAGHAISIEEMRTLLQGRRPERIVLRYDWDRFLGSFSYYDDIPFLSEEAAQHLVDIGVRLVAMDTPMPDNPKNGKGSANDSPIHHLLLGHGILIVEYLVNIKAITQTEVTLMVLPLKIKAGDGAPVRCIAIENHE